MIWLPAWNPLCCDMTTTTLDPHYGDMTVSTGSTLRWQDNHCGDITASRATVMVAWLPGWDLHCVGMTTGLGSTLWWHGTYTVMTCPPLWSLHCEKVTTTVVPKLWWHLHCDHWTTTDDMTTVVVSTLWWHDYHHDTYTVITWLPLW